MNTERNRNDPPNVHTNFIPMIFLVSIGTLALFSANYASKLSCTEFKITLPLIVSFCTFPFVYFNADKKEKLFTHNKILFSIIIALVDLLIMQNLAILLFRSSLFVTSCTLSIFAFTRTIKITDRRVIYKINLIVPFFSLVFLKCLYVLELFEYKNIIFQVKSDISKSFVVYPEVASLSVVVFCFFRRLFLKILEDQPVYRDSQVESSLAILIYSFVFAVSNNDDFKKEIKCLSKCLIPFFIAFTSFTYVYFTVYNRNQNVDYKNTWGVVCSGMGIIHILWFIPFVDVVFMKNIVEKNMDSVYVLFLVVHLFPTIYYSSNIVDRISIFRYRRFTRFDDQVIIQNNNEIENDPSVVV